MSKYKCILCNKYWVARDIWTANMIIAFSRDEGIRINPELRFEYYTQDHLLRHEHILKLDIIERIKEIVNE